GRLNKVFSLNEIRAKRALEIVLQPMAETLAQANFAQELATVIEPFTIQHDEHTKRIPIHIQVDTAYASGTIALADQWQVRPEDELLRLLRELLGKQAIFINYQVKTKSMRVEPANLEVTQVEAKRLEATADTNQ